MNVWLVWLVVTNWICRSSPLLCWKCHARNQRECNRIGTPQICHSNQACVTEWREENGITIMTKRCKQKEVCQRMQSQNRRRCKAYRRGLNPSICFDCCWERNNCNRHRIPPHTTARPTNTPTTVAMRTTFSTATTTGTIQPSLSLPVPTSKTDSILSTTFYPTLVNRPRTTCVCTRAVEYNTRPAEAALLIVAPDFDEWRSYS
ncbi:uncharacterized protein LOC113474845 [Ciona intestinalis]